MNRLCIVLCRPEKSGNVGAVCRAMATCGIDCLRIVGSRDGYNDRQVRSMAVHASAIWENAEFFESITDAVKDCAMSFGTTRRRGKNRKGKLLLPEDFARFAERGGSALVFGCERTGLTDEEISECTMGLTIPASPKFPSYNLSHAVQILCYEAFRASPQGAFSPGWTPVTLERVEKTVSVITDRLAQIGFFSFAGRPGMERFWRDILSRAALTEGEAVYIERIFTKAAGLAGRGQSP
jgi:tRNA/rRNA methyltransferase